MCRSGVPMTMKTILSASRRTDIPAFHMEWFMRGIDKGFFCVENPFTRRISTVDATAGAVHSIVFWSKDFGTFLRQGHGDVLEKKGYPLFFLFTVNSRSNLLEPNVPPLEIRLGQARQLADRFGAGSVGWRFDPVCFFTDRGGGLHDNLADFPRIAASMAEIGIRRCTTSFLDIYAKVKRRTRDMAGVSFFDPPAEKKKRVLLKMGAVLAPYGISLYTCCEDELTALLPGGGNVFPGACIDAPFLAGRFGGRPSFARDAGQRRKKGCRCSVSRDIGSYGLHSCFHECLYCYARPKGERTART